MFERRRVFGSRVVGNGGERYGDGRRGRVEISTLLIACTIAVILFVVLACSILLSNSSAPVGFVVFVFNVGTSGAS